MRVASSIVLGVLALVAQGGCGTHLYKQWDRQLSQMCLDQIEARFYTVDDVSLLLGTPPEDCDTSDVPSPLTIGVIFDTRAGEPVVPRVAAVFPKSPAESAGLRSGDLILSVGGTSVASVAEVKRVIAEVAPGERLVVVTDRSTFEVIPAEADYQQCYWHIVAGRVSRAAGSGTWTRHGGGTYYGSTAYERYYRATCRFLNGRLYTFNSNWQM